MIGHGRELRKLTTLLLLLLLIMLCRGGPSRYCCTKRRSSEKDLVISYAVLFVFNFCMFCACLHFASPALGATEGTPINHPPPLGGEGNNFTLPRNKHVTTLFTILGTATVTHYAIITFSSHPRPKRELRPAWPSPRVFRSHAAMSRARVPLLPPRRVHARLASNTCSDEVKEFRRKVPQS